MEKSHAGIAVAEQCTCILRMGRFLIVSLAGSVVLAQGPHRACACRGQARPGAFRFAAVDEASLGLWEGDRPILVYNHGIRSKQGNPAPKPHSCYIHPLYGLDGEVLTDDFPADHLHHRGVFWAWPHVTVDGRHSTSGCRTASSPASSAGACGGPRRNKRSWASRTAGTRPAGRS